MRPTETLTTAIVDAVAERDGVDPTTLSPPLAETIDTDALNRLFEHGEGRVTLTYGNYRVTVWSDGGVELNSLADTT